MKKNLFEHVAVTFSFYKRRGNDIYGSIKISIIFLSIPINKCE